MAKEVNLPRQQLKIFSLIHTCQNLLFDELQTTSVESVNLMNPIIGHFYNLDQLRKFTFLMSEISLEILTEEIDQDLMLLTDYELQYFSQTVSFSLFDDFFSVKSLLAQELLAAKPKTANIIRNYLAFIYDRSIDHCILHKRYQVRKMLAFLIIEFFLLFLSNGFLSENRSFEKKIDLLKLTLNIGLL